MAATTSAAGAFVVSGALAGVIATNFAELTPEYTVGISLGVGAGVAAITYLISPDAPKKAPKGGRRKGNGGNKSSKKEDTKKGGKGGKKGGNVKKTQPKKEKAQKSKGTDSAAETSSGVPSSSAADSSKGKKENKKGKKGKKEQPPLETLSARVYDASVDSEGWSKVTTAKDKEEKKRKKKKDAKGKGEESSASAKQLPDGHIKGTISVPRERFGDIIGKAGSVLNKLREATGCEISVPDKSSSSDVITITGPIQGVDRVKGAISNIVKKGYSSITHPGHTQAEVRIPNGRGGAVFGKGGENMKMITGATGVRVNTTDNVMVITGPKANVKVAKDAFQQLCDEGYSPITHPGWSRREIEFPRQYINQLIGKGGQTIKSIQGDTKTRINIPDAEDPNQNVGVVGSAEGVARAIDQIKAVLAKIDEPDEAAEQDEADWNDDGGFDAVGADGGWGSLNAAGGDWVADGGW